MKTMNIQKEVLTPANMKKAKAQAEVIQKLDDLKKGTLLYKIASAMINVNGYYFYINLITEEKSFVSN